MTEIKINIPDNLSEMIDDIDSPLYLEAIKSVVKKNLSKKKKELALLKRKIDRYEQRYAATYKVFSENLADLPSAHDDWIEWTYIQKSYDVLSSSIVNLDLLLKK